jgi:hypothetical protein
LKDRFVNKWLGAIIMRMVGKSRAKMFDEPPRENLTNQLNSMSGAIEKDFFGGESPNGADFANYGILRSMQGLNGFDIVENHDVIWPWYSRMQLLSDV